jgi:hypothetical protein
VEWVYCGRVQLHGVARGSTPMCTRKSFPRDSYTCAKVSRQEKRGHQTWGTQLFIKKQLVGEAQAGAGIGAWLPGSFLLY